MTDKGRIIKSKEEYKGKEPYEDYKNKRLIYIYVEDELLKIPNGQKFQCGRLLADRVQGIHLGQFRVNKSCNINANYDYEVILLALKYCKFDILNALSRVKIKDESHKVNLIFSIIEKNINIVSDKLKSKKIVEQKVNTVEIAEESKLKYKRKSKEVTNKRLKDLI